MLTDGLAYEITLEVSDRHRDRFEDWFPNVVLDWTVQPDVRSFRVYRGVDADGQRLRLVFTFEDEADWERFVQRGAHRERMATLESVADSVRTSLWAPTAVSLHGDGDTLVPVRGDELTDDGEAALVSTPVGSEP